MRNLKQELKDLMKIRKWSQNEVGKRFTYSAGSISNYMNDCFSGDLEKFEKELTEFIDLENDKIESPTPIVPFVKLSNYKKFVDIAALAQNDCEICACCGVPGSGKTRSIKQFMKNNSQTILVEIDPGYSTKVILRELAKKLGIDDSGSIHELRERITIEVKGRELLIIFDEAESMPHRAFELIRRIWDKSLDENYQGTVGILFVGTPKLIHLLKGLVNQYAQLYQRVGWYKKLNEKLSDNDIQLMVNAMFPNSINMWKTFKKYSNANTRILSNLLKRCSRVAGLNNCEIDDELIAKTSQTLIIGSEQTVALTPMN